MLLTGLCRCKATSYTLDYPAIPVAYACHCLECQAMSGGACVVQLPIAEHRLSVSGALITWENRDSGGNTTTQRFCAACKTRIFSTNTGRPGMALVRGGTLVQSDALAPALHIWTKRKQPWIILSADAPAYPEAAPIDVSMALFAPNFAAS
jgi:hypothetical protein